MQFMLEHAALAIGVITSVGGGIAWYSAYIRKQYGAERDFQHLRRNYESLAAAINQLSDDLDQRCDKVDSQLLQQTAMLQNLVFQICRSGDSQGWS
jgi:hypothetical protein